MSIFKVQDIDFILIELLNIDDLRNLYQANRYYRDKIFAILEPFIKFYQNIDAIKLPKWIEHNNHFNKAIVYGNLQICKYLINANKKMDKLSRPGSLFKITKWLRFLRNLHVSKNKYDNEQINEAFQLSYIHGYLDIAKWLYSLDNINIHANNNEAFRYSCRNGRLEVAKWLYSLGNVNIHFNDDYAFQFSCANGHLEVAKWLYSLGNVTICEWKYDSFLLGCKNGHLEVTKWLYSLGGININAYHNFAFRWTYSNGHLEVAKWLCTLDSRYKIQVINEKIKYTIGL